MANVSPKTSGEPRLPPTSFLCHHIPIPPAKAPRCFIAWSPCLCSRTHARAGSQLAAPRGLVVLRQPGGTARWTWPHYCWSAPLSAIDSTSALSPRSRRQGDDRDRRSPSHSRPQTGQSVALGSEIPDAAGHSAGGRKKKLQVDQRNHPGIGQSTRMPLGSNGVVARAGALRALHPGRLKLLEP